MRRPGIERSAPRPSLVPSSRTRTFWPDPMQSIGRAVTSWNVVVRGRFVAASDSTVTWRVLVSLNDCEGCDDTSASPGVNETFVEPLRDERRTRRATLAISGISPPSSFHLGRSRAARRAPAPSSHLGRSRLSRDASSAASLPPFGPTTPVSYRWSQTRKADGPWVDRGAFREPVQAAIGGGRGRGLRSPADGRCDRGASRA